jgi:ketosteroid isomerase-like protein
MSTKPTWQGNNWAFECGAYSITLTSRAGGEPIRDTGKYITSYTRSGAGRWLMARDIWNSNNQPAPQV